jgi:hypothetical protein
MLERPSRRQRRRQHTRARQARYRERQQAGVVVIPFALTTAESATLHRLKYLDESELESRDALGRALHALLGNIKE